MKENFVGSYGVLVTPFTDDGKSVDTQKLKNLIDWQIKSKAPGIIILGTTGEFLAVSDEERDLIIETTVKHVAGRIKVLVGTTNAFTPTAVRYSKQAQEFGCDGLMILPPYYYTPTQDEIYQYYKSICEVVSIPIMLYNNPFTSNVDMPAKLVAKLAKSFEQIIGTRGFTGKKTVSARGMFDVLFSPAESKTSTDELDTDLLDNLENSL